MAALSKRMDLVSRLTNFLEDRPPQPRGLLFEAHAPPMPGPVEDDGGRLPASYANFYIANGTVLVPTYDHQNDQRALSILQDLFADRRVIGIPCTDLVLGFGALHCVTMQQPAFDRSYQPS